MNLINVDKMMLLEDLYILRAKIAPENEEAREQLTEIIEYITNAPISSNQSNYPRISTRNR